MSSNITDKILERIHQPELIKLLAEELSGTELNSLLLEVFNQRAQSIKPAQLLSQYQKNRFVKPGDVPVLELLQWEIDLLNLFNKFSFKPLELSPVSVFGSCAAVATADQKKILSAMRGTEVLADATNAIALHCCDLKRQNKLPDTLRFSCIQRHVRAQQIEAKGFTPHFKIGCLVTSGSDRGSFLFEKEALMEHMTVMLATFRDYFGCDSISFRLLERPGYENTSTLGPQVKEFIESKNKDLKIEVAPHPEKENHYYQGIQYKVDISIKGRQFEIGDGGFVDWPQQLLQNKKERMLTTGIGFELMYRIVHKLI